MQHINQLFKEQNLKNKPWLIIGKGPSFAKIKNYDLSKYYTFGLNHVVKEVDNLDITHLIDFNVFEVCEKEIYEKAKYLCMPINPHFDNKATDKTLKDLIKENKILAKLSEEGRLFWYNHLEDDRFLNADNFERNFYENIKVKYFSAEVPFYVLGMNGIKEIYSIGVDGGSNYSKTFKESATLPNGKSSLLSNGRNSFDIQFDEIIKTINKYDLIYSPIDADYPVKIYVGSQEEQMLSVKVLEYSIKKRTNVDVEVFPIHKAGIEYPIPKDPNNRQRTPFSFQRFLIPELNGFKGRAIYVDSDMQVLKDIRQLWNLPMAANDLLTVKNKEESNRVPQFSVMLLDCNKLQWSINDIVKMLDDGELNYDSLMKEMKAAKNIGVKIDCGWNCLEWFEKDKSSLIHYTDMPTQPWVSTENPIGKIWIYDLINAIKEGFIPLSYVKDHVKKGWVRPSLLYQIENNIIDSLQLPKEAIKLDKDFIAPYKKMNKKPQSNKNLKIMNQDDRIKLIKKELNKLFKSRSYRYFIRILPGIKKKLKKIKNISKDIKETKKIEVKNNIKSKRQIPFNNYKTNQTPSGYIEKLSDNQLEELNNIISWNCFTADTKGRRFGNLAWNGKRDKPNQIPDYRIITMDKKFKLKDKSVLEVGCFEGIHTIALCKMGAIVDAIDVRVENVVKTILRSNMFGFYPKTYCLDIEKESPDNDFDFIHHVGVLYHLKDPVSHLKTIGKITKKGLMLDTHYSSLEQADKTYKVGNKNYPYYFYKEKGYEDVFSGAYDHAKWLTIDSIKEILSSVGFNKIEIEEDRNERNGKRCLLFAYK